MPLEPFSTFKPLKVVCDAIWVISAICCCTCWSSAWRSDALFEPLADSTARVRMLCRLLTMVVSAPAAVCDSDTASFALLIAWLVPLTWVVNCWLIARPAASSAALLMRRPEDRRVNDCDSSDCEPFRLFCATIESMLVLRTSDITVLRV